MVTENKRKTLSKKLLSIVVVASMLVTSVPASFSADAKVDYSAKTTSVSSDGSSTFTLNNDTLEIKNGSNIIDLEACDPEILKVNYKPNGQESEDTLALDPDKKWNDGDIISYDLQSDPVEIKTDKMTVKIDKDDLDMSIYNSANGLLVKQSALPKDNSVTLNHNSDQRFYGIYSKGNSRDFDSPLRNGDNEVRCGGQGQEGGPFVWTTSGYGLLVDSDGGKINVQDSSLTYSGISKKDTEYYVMVGNPTEVMEAEAKVSGTSPMLPKWATGFTNTQWGWPDANRNVEDQLKDVINTYRSKELPIDNFCLDWDWKYWGTGDNYGEFTWNAKHFPGAHSGEFKNWMDSKGMKMTGITKPRLFLGTQEAQDMDNIGGWINDKVKEDYCAKKPVKQVDFKKPQVRQWWWNHSIDAFNKGIKGFWNDECDQDWENGFGNFDNMNMQRAMYEGQTSYTSEERPWSLNRCFYTGAQRYAYANWSGDIGSGFQVMKQQKDRLIASVNLGQPKWGMDTGGFQERLPEATRGENFTRWMQFSAFVPVFRVHSENCDPGGRGELRYPWLYGDKAEKAIKDVMHFRYEHIPYIYKYENDAYTKGTGLVKSLMQVYPNDPNTATDTDAWMFGDYMLVSPVLDQGQTSKDIYLPKGTWYDYKSGRKYEGGQTINVATDAENWSDVPLFIKQGAIIPSQDYENYVGEKKMTNIYVDTFSDAKETSFDYYDDNGNSTDYKDGNYFKQTLKLARNAEGTGVKFTTEAKEGSYTPDVKYYIVKMHEKDITGVPAINGKDAKNYSNLESLKNAQGEGYALGQDAYGTVAYVKIAAGDEKTVEIKCDIPFTTYTNNIYVRSTENAAKLQYSINDGKTWNGDVSMNTSADMKGYLEGSVSYKLAGNHKVRVRYADNSGFKPSAEGIELPESDSNTFTIEKDGSINEGMPSLNKTKICLTEDEKVNSVLFQYKDEEGNWSKGDALTPYCGVAGHFQFVLSFPKDIESNTVRYSLDNGATWLPSESGEDVDANNYINDDVNIIKGEPKWDNIVTIYYNTNAGYKTPYVHWRAENGTWTVAPGTKMTPSEVEGYYKAELNIGQAETAEVCFNNGGSEWQNNDGKNYIFNKGVSGFENGQIVKFNLPAKKNVFVYADVKGGRYTEAQKVTLTAAPEGADIYYTLDGTNPTTASTKYTEPVEINNNAVLKAVAVKDGETSDVLTNSYTIGKVQQSRIYFKKQAGWGNSIKAYVYTQGSGSTKELAKWPGTSMIKESNGLYSFTLTDIDEDAYVIFTDGNRQVPGVNQQGFLLKKGESKIYEDGKWTDYTGGTVEPVKTESEIYVQKPNNWGMFMKVYIYNEETGAARILAPWPGTLMNNEGNGIYSYKLSNWEGNAYVIFTDGKNQTPGSGQKGFLLKQGEKKIYKNGLWSDYIK